MLWVLSPTLTLKCLLKSYEVVLAVSSLPESISLVLSILWTSKYVLWNVKRIRIIKGFIIARNQHSSKTGFMKVNQAILDKSKLPQEILANYQEEKMHGFITAGNQMPETIFIWSGKDIIVETEHCNLSDSVIKLTTVYSHSLISVWCLHNKTGSQIRPR